MNHAEASDLFDLASALRSLTAEIAEHFDDKRPATHAYGLITAAEILAAQLADLVWEHVEREPLPGQDGAEASS